MTHMAPSYRSLNAEEQRHPLAGFFASDLERLIRELRPALWIHGHIYTALEYPLGATAIVANPRGNPGEKVNASGRSSTPKIVAVWISEAWCARCSSRSPASGLPTETPPGQENGLEGRLLLSDDIDGSKRLCPMIAELHQRGFSALDGIMA